MNKRMNTLILNTTAQLSPKVIDDTVAMETERVGGLFYFKHGFQPQKVQLS